MSEIISRTIFAGLLIYLWYCAHDLVVYNTFNFIIHGIMMLECAAQLRSREFSAICLMGILGYKYANIFMNLSQETVLMYIAMTSISDIAQYFTGRFCGNKHLFRWISPSKTLEGYLGGLVSLFIISPYFDVSVADILWIYISGIAGDLCASAFKRTFKIKHFSPLLGGHGGILDRFDSYIGIVILS